MAAISKHVTTPTSITGTDLSLALLDQAGLAAYERDPLGTNFTLWLTRPENFAGGPLVAEPAAPLSNKSAFLKRVYFDDQPKLKAAIEKALEGDGTYRIDYRLQLSSEAYVWVQDSGRIEYATSGLPLKSRGVITFLEPYVARAEAAEFAAAYDPLTGRPNRQEFERQLDAALDSSASGVVLVVSIDNMTWLNEAIGPNAANDLLLSATQRLDRLVPDAALISRTGGDAFGIFLQDLDVDGLEPIAERVVQSFRDQHFITPDSTLNISVSIGAVLVPESAATGIAALTRAEQALKTGRSNGRSAFRLYEDSEDRRSYHLSSLAELDQVQKAIANDCFVLAYQPIIDALSGEMAFCEGLLRLKQPDGSYTVAFSLIKTLEAHGLAQDLDRHVVGLALKTLADNKDLVLSINISGATASDAAFQKFLTARLTGREDLARRMIIEITETAAIRDLEETSRFVTLVHAFGGRIALDDFGEGFTALQHLRHLAVDYLKIDGGLIKGIAENAAHQVMVKAILSMAQHMNIKTVAEFVETEREAAWLQRHGGDFLQGWYFGKAETALPKTGRHAINPQAQAFIASTGMLTLSI